MRDRRLSRVDGMSPANSLIERRTESCTRRMTVFCERLSSSTVKDCGTANRHHIRRSSGRATLRHLIDVPLSVLSRLTAREKLAVLEWVEMVQDRVARMEHVPFPEPKSIRGCLSAAQLLGEWSSFTDWRPAKALPGQLNLFGDDA